MIKRWSVLNLYIHATMREEGSFVLFDEEERWNEIIWKVNWMLCVWWGIQTHTH